MTALNSKRLKSSSSHVLARSPTIFVATPYPPDRNGIAYYCADLYGALSRQATLNFVLATESPAPEPPAFPAQFVRNYTFSGIPNGAVLVCHLANNEGCVHALDLAMRYPAVVVLHDVALHYLFECYARHYGWDAYGEAIERAGSPGGNVLLSQMRDLRIGGSFFRDEVDLAGVALSRAKAVIVHSNYAARRLERLGVEAPIHVIRHFARSPKIQDPALRRQTARAAHHIGPDDFLVCSFGFATGAKRVDLIIKAIQELRSSGLAAGARYIHVGDGLSAFPPNLLANADSSIEVTGTVDDEVFLSYMDAADVVVNLRDPSSGETSGPLTDALARGAFTIVSNTKSYSDFDTMLVPRIMHGPDELRDLVALLARLSVSDPAELSSRRVTVQRHYSAMFSIELAAHRHMTVYKENIGA